MFANLFRDEPAKMFTIEEDLTTLSLMDKGLTKWEARQKGEVSDEEFLATVERMHQKEEDPHPLPEVKELPKVEEPEKLILSEGQRKIVELVKKLIGAKSDKRFKSIGFPAPLLITKPGYGLETAIKEACKGTELFTISIFSWVLISGRGGVSTLNQLKRLDEKGPVVLYIKDLHAFTVKNTCEYSQYLKMEVLECFGLKNTIVVGAGYWDNEKSLSNEDIWADSTAESGGGTSKELICKFAKKIKVDGPTQKDCKEILQHAGIKSNRTFSDFNQLGEMVLDDILG